jgi:hypothetical protein
MKSFFRITLLFLPLGICTNHIKAQAPFDNLIRQIQSSLGKYRNDFPQEKIFVHTDRNSYTAGETIWFKTYTTLEGKPSDLSRIVYVELVNEKGIVTDKKMLKLSKGSAPGELLLPGNLPSGNYSLNAYTLWMLNFPYFIYRKNIYVYNTDYKNLPGKAEVKKNEVRMAFFPEGGDLVNGVSSKIAFQALDKMGLPATVGGTIVNKAGTVITNFQSEHDGMGVFELSPVAGENYTARLQLSNGKTASFDLPAAKAAGIVLQVNNDNLNKLFIIADRGENNKDQFNEILIVAQMNGELIQTARFNFTNEETAVAMAKKDLPPGILQITAFDATGNPLAERLAFISNYDNSSLQLNTDSLSLQPGAVNILSLNLGTNYTNADVSIAITDASLNPGSAKEDNIFSRLFMNADIKGYIHNAGYYLKDKAPLTLQHADLVMRVNGWRRFTWKKALQNDFGKLNFPVESAIGFRGIVYNNNNEPIENGRADVFVKAEDSTQILSKAKLGRGGEFMVTDLNFNKKAWVYYQGTNEASANTKTNIKIFPAYFDTLSVSSRLPETDMDTTAVFYNRSNPYFAGMANMISSKQVRDSVKQLAEVRVTAKKISRVDSLAKVYVNEGWQNSSFTFEPNNRFFVNVWQLIQQNVPGIRVQGNPLSPDVTLARLDGQNAGNAFGIAANPDAPEEGGDPNSQLYNGMAFFLNEVNVDKTTIDNLSVDDIALIKFYRAEGAFFSGASATISIYTKRGSGASGDPRVKSFLGIQRSGYSVVREFYNTEINIKENEARPTLYWNPKLRFSKDGKSRIVFLNNNITRKMKIVVNGIDKNGQLIHTEKIVE